MEEFAGQVGDRFQFTSWFNTLHCNDVVFPFGMFFLQQHDWIEWVEVMLYTAGFPCQPYSVLSSTRLMLSDPNARQLWAVIRNMKRTRPMEPRILSAKFAFFIFACVILSPTILLGHHSLRVGKRLRWGYWRTYWVSDQCFTWSQKLSWKTCLGHSARW